MIATGQEGSSIWLCSGWHHYVLYDEDSGLELAEHLKMEEVMVPPFFCVYWARLRSACQCSFERVAQPAVPSLHSPAKNVSEGCLSICVWQAFWVQEPEKNRPRKLFSIISCNNKSLMQYMLRTCQRRRPMRWKTDSLAIKFQTKSEKHYMNKKNQ